MNHDSFSRTARALLERVFGAPRELMTQPDPPTRPIGFIDPDDNGSTKSGGGPRPKI